MIIQAPQWLIGLILSKGAQVSIGYPALKPANLD